MKSWPGPRLGGPPTAALTFDDATRDQYENAAPLLEARGLRGSFFVIGETLAGRLPFTHQLHLLFSQLSPRELVERYHRFLAEQFPAAGAEFRIPTDRHLNPLRLHDDVYTANFKERFPATPPAWQQKFLRQIFAEQGLREKSLTADLFMSAAGTLSGFTARPIGRLTYCRYRKSNRNSSDQSPFSLIV